VIFGLFLKEKFWVVLGEDKNKDKSNGNDLVASPCGLRSGLRQSGTTHLTKSRAMNGCPGDFWLL
jgi:hypothetical protein